MIPIHMTIDHEHECSVQMRSHATQNICIICVRCSCQPCECLTCGMPSISKKSSRGCFSLWCLMARVLGQASVMKNIDWILIVRSIMLVISVVDAMFFVLCSHTFIIWTIFFLYRFFFLLSFCLCVCFNRFSVLRMHTLFRAHFNIYSVFTRRTIDNHNIIILITHRNAAVSTKSCKIPW